MIQDRLENAATQAEPQTRKHVLLHRYYDDDFFFLTPNTAGFRCKDPLRQHHVHNASFFVKTGSKGGMSSSRELCAWRNPAHLRLFLHTRAT
jgi:hypothetical protein